MSLFPIESRLVGGAVETVPGTAETLVSADYDVRAYELSLSSLEQEMDDANKYATGDMTRALSIAGIATGGIDIALKLARGEFEYIATSYDDYKLPFAKYLQACGLELGVNLPTDEATEDGSFEFFPSMNANLQPITGAVLDIDSQTGDGVEYSLYGLMGTLTIDMETGKPFNANISLTGGVADVVDVPAVSVPEFIDANALSTIPAVMLDTVVRLTELDADGSVKPAGIVTELCLETANLDTGVTVSMVKCQASPSGVLYSTITSREPKISINPRLSKQSELPFWASIKNMSTWKIEIIGTDIEILVPRGQMITSALGDTDGFVSNELTFAPLRNIQGADAAAKQKTYAVTIKGDNISS